LLSTSFVFGLVSRGSSSPWPSTVASLLDAAIILVAAGLRYQKLQFLFRLHPAKLRDVVALAAMALLFVSAASAYFWLIERLGVPIGSTSNEYLRAGWPLWAMFLLVSVMPAIFEELAFRGVIQSSLERILNSRDAWLIQAAL